MAELQCDRDAFCHSQKKPRPDYWKNCIKLKFRMINRWLNEPRLDRHYHELSVSSITAIHIPLNNSSFIDAKIVLNSFEFSELDVGRSNVCWSTDE